MMASAEKVVDYVSAVLSSLIPKPVDIVVKPLIKPITDNLKAWFAAKETQKFLLEAARKAEDDFRERAKEQFGNDRLSQVVVSFPLHNGDLFQAALQSLPSHLNETILETHLSNDLTKYWPDEFTPEELRIATALYLDCLRLRLLRVPGFAEVITRLAVLRTDRRTEEMQNILNEIREMLSGLINKDNAGIVFRSLHQLPQPPADFTGRDELIGLLVADFEKGKGATITGLTGMGGIGKTSLGLVVAHQVAKNYPDAQIFLDLKGTADLKGKTKSLSAMDAMRHVILSFEPTMDIKTLDEAGMSNAYRSVLHGKQVLLFLDNARSAEQIAPLRPPETCAMLVTSRWVFPVEGLHSLQVDLMSEENAIAFLLELCPRVGNKAAELAKACAYLPLALRIAGSFLSVNRDRSVEKYLVQLDDRKGSFAAFKKSREKAELTTEPDLRETFELSYNELSEEERKRWRMLSVFPTSFAASAAAAMWDLDPERDETADVLSLLLRYSLLDYDEPSSRYSLHNLLADFALMEMDKDEEVNARIAHSVHYSQVLGNINQMYLRGGENVLPCLRLYDLEWLNIEAGQHSSAMYLEANRQAAQACNWYAWQASINDLRLKPNDQRKWIEAGLRAAKVLGNREAEEAHLGNLGVSYFKLGEVRKAIEFHERQLAIAREIDKRSSEGAALGNLGNAYAALGDAFKATAFRAQALLIYRELGDRRGEGVILGDLAAPLSNLGNVDKAIELDERQLAIAHKTGDRRGEGNALHNLGTAYKNSGNIQKAIEYYEQALLIYGELGDRRGEGNALGNLGIVHKNLGETRKAIEFYEQVLVIHREIGDRGGEAKALGNLGIAYYDLGEKEKAVGFTKQALTIFEAIESPNAERARKQLKEWETPQKKGSSWWADPLSLIKRWISKR